MSCGRDGLYIGLIMRIWLKQGTQHQNRMSQNEFCFPNSDFIFSTISNFSQTHKLRLLSVISIRLIQIQSSSSSPSIVSQGISAVNITNVPRWDSKLIYQITSEQSDYGNLWWFLFSGKSHLCHHGNSPKTRHYFSRQICISWSQDDDGWIMEIGMTLKECPLIPLPTNGGGGPYWVDVSNTMRQKEREIINCADVLLEGLDVAEWYIHWPLCSPSPFPGREWWGIQLLVPWMLQRHYADVPIKRVPKPLLFERAYSGSRAIARWNTEIQRIRWSPPSD